MGTGARQIYFFIGYQNQHARKNCTIFSPSLGSSINIIHAISSLLGFMFLERMCAYMFLPFKKRKFTASLSYQAPILCGEREETPFVDLFASMN